MIKVITHFRLADWLFYFRWEQTQVYEEFPMSLVSKYFKNYRLSASLYLKIYIVMTFETTDNNILFWIDLNYIISPYF